MLPATLFKMITFNAFNLLTPLCDQDRISPYNIKQTSDVWTKKNIK